MLCTQEAAEALRQGHQAPTTANALLWSEVLFCAAQFARPDAWKVGPGLGVGVTSVHHVAKQICQGITAQSAHGHLHSKTFIQSFIRLCCSHAAGWRGCAAQAYTSRNKSCQRLFVERDPQREHTPFDSTLADQVNTKHTLQGKECGSYQQRTETLHALEPVTACAAA